MSPRRGPASERQVKQVWWSSIGGQPPWQATSKVESSPANIGAFANVEFQEETPTLAFYQRHSTAFNRWTSVRSPPRPTSSPPPFNPSLAVITTALRGTIAHGAVARTKKWIGQTERAIMHLLTDPMFYICMFTNFTVIYLTALAGSGRDDGSVDDFVD
jgi:hypothetical protein